jgi:hypothetical protein
MDIPLVHLIITLEHGGGEPSPNGLAGLKRHFPGAFRRAIGCDDGHGDCSAGPDCRCRAIFAQTISPDPHARRRYQKPPLPFAFQVPDLAGVTKKGARCELSLVLFGGATAQLETFLTAVQLLFSPRCPNRLRNLFLCSIEAAAADGSRTLLPIGGDLSQFSSLPLLSFNDLFSTDLPATASVILTLQTPLRLLHHGSPVRELPFSVVAGALFRRISSLAYYYGGVEMPHDFKWLAERSRSVISCRSDLHWVDRGNGFQGVEGEVTYGGPLDEFLPFLMLGSRLNLGKGAAYGMGCYRLSC